MCRKATFWRAPHLISVLSPVVTGSGKEPPDVCGARGGGDPQGADQGAGGEEQPAGAGELPAEESGQPWAAGEVPVPHPHRRAAGQPELPAESRPAGPHPQHRLCCVSGSALGRAEPLSPTSNGPPFLNEALQNKLPSPRSLSRQRRGRDIEGCTRWTGHKRTADSDKHKPLDRRRPRPLHNRPSRCHTLYVDKSAEKIEREEGRLETKRLLWDSLGVWKSDPLPLTHLVRTLLATDTRTEGVRRCWSGWPWQVPPCLSEKNPIMWICPSATTRSCITSITHFNHAPRTFLYPRCIAHVFVSI